LHRESYVGRLAPYFYQENAYTMWFKNVKAYQITQPLSLDEGDLERALNEHAFRP